MSHPIYTCPQCGEEWCNPHCPKCSEEQSELAAPAGSVRVRIAVAVCPSGKWNSCGWSGGSDKELIMFAGETLEEDGEEYYFVEATLPIPFRTHPIAVEGNVSPNAELKHCGET